MMKTNAFTYPLSILMSFMLLTACESENARAEAAIAKEKLASKTIRQVMYIDNGAVVPMPNMQQITLNVEDTLKMQLMFWNMNGGVDTTKSSFTITDAQIREELRDNLTELSDIPDGSDIKQGKAPCVGANNIDIAMIFSSGDTSRFSILGAARCDKSLCQPFWSIDSIAKIILNKNIH